MKLYKIEQRINNDYDTFDSAVVAASNATRASMIIPGGYTSNIDKSFLLSVWTAPENVIVTYLGEASEEIEEGAIVSSFNAG